MKDSKKETLDKYKQGEFTNYKNALPPKTLVGYGWDFVSKLAEDYMKADLKAEAIAFGEWLLKYNCWVFNEKSWIKETGVDPVTGEEAYSYYTTEELYNEYLKSKS